jgi:hypothetical protein
MIRVYVAGAYSANNVIDVLKNIGRGDEYCTQLFLNGFAPFNPWSDRTFVMLAWKHKFTVQQFYDYSITWLKVSNCLFLVPEWRNSKGTIKEIKIAKKLKLPIFETLTELKLHYHK